MSRPEGGSHISEDSAESEAGRSKRRIVLLCIVAVVVIAAGATSAWAVSSHNSQVQAQASASASESSRKASEKAQASQKAKTQASDSALKVNPASPTSSAQPSDPSSAGQTDPGAPQPDPGAPQPDPAGNCAAYQGTYVNAQGGKASLAVNCSIEADSFGSHIQSVQTGGPGASGQVAGALELIMEPHNGNAVAYTLFPQGVGAGYPGEDTSHNRLINHSGGPISVMSYQDFMNAVYILQ
ncbi:hypothetical protein KIMH_10030 [Bombiscardovia apis]|uniref:Lipoprotein n=1 Tax=Bombiscardovia apis TaxID=2932182 RepID=A0ABM8BDB3_9BIFI|nr:hypothetical protein [Bombiscardovia apis]BDR54892.1 hypothetical protein KIMH_10030 [Bombiscardovia apis]